MRLLCTAVVESLNCLYQASDRQSFVERVVAAADSFFPGCVIAWHDIDGRSGAADRHHANIAPPDMGKIWSRVALDSPVVRYYLNGGRDSLTFTRDIISMRDFRKTRAYQESWKPVGAVDQMGVNFTAPGRVFGLSIKRDRRFCEEDRRLMRARDSMLWTRLRSRVLRRGCIDAKGTRNSGVDSKGEAGFGNGMHFRHQQPHRRQTRRTYSREARGRDARGRGGVGPLKYFRAGRCKWSLGPTPPLPLGSYLVPWQERGFLDPPLHLQVDARSSRP